MLARSFYAEIRAKYLRCVMLAVREMTKAEDGMTIYVHEGGFRGDAIFDAKSVECKWELNKHCFDDFDYPFQIDHLTLRFKIKSLEKQIELAKDDDVIELMYERGKSSLNISYCVNNSRTKTLTEYCGRMKLLKVTEAAKPTYLADKDVGYEDSTTMAA